MGAGIRRGLFIILALAGALAASPRAHAQAQPGGGGANQVGASRQGLGLGFGQVVMFGDMGSKFSNHIGFNLNYDYEAGPTFGLYVNLHVSSHGDDVDPADSLSLKGLIPNLKVNIFRTSNLTFSVFGGLGAYMVGETLAGSSASFLLFSMDAGAMVNVEVDHIRFGPSLSFITFASGTDNSGSTAAAGSTATTSTTPLTAGGSNVELFFNIMYMF